MAKSTLWKILLVVALVSPSWGATKKAAKEKSAAPAPQAQPVAPADAGAPSGGQALGGENPLSETVKGEIKEKLDIQKPPPSIELNVKEIIDSGTSRTDEVLQQAQPIPSDADFANYASLSSNQTIQPWMPILPTPPLVTFYPGLSKVVAKRWEFKVSDQGGEVIKTVSGKGIPPRSVQWDGRNERGEFITVGTLYSYTFATYDDHGNASTFPGEPFQLDALMYEQKGRVVVEFSNDKLFLADQATLNPVMTGLWERALDVVRENSNKPILVEVYADSVKSPLAEERRQKLINSISDSTNIPAVDIRHKVDKVADRGNIVRLVMGAK